MNQVRLPRLFSLIREGGFWILRTGDDAKPTHNQGQVLSPSMVRIGPALGSEALSERSALLLARRHIVVRSRGDIRTNCSRLTVLDFVRDQFVPAFVSAKSSSVRSYYGSALNYVLTPDEVGRMFNADLVQGKKHRSTFPDWPYLNNIRLCDVQLKHVQQLIDSAMNSGYSPQTIKHIRSVVATILSYAKQELMYVGPNPALAAKLPESCRKDRPALTLEQLEQVLRSMRYPEREMTMMALLTDLTVSEICGLQWKNVNLTGGWSEIERQPIPPISIFVNKQWYRGKLAK